MARIVTDDANERAWRSRSLSLWKDVSRFSGNYPPAINGSFNTSFTMLTRSCGGLTTRWEGPTREALASRLLTPAALRDARSATLYRVLKLGHALAFDRRARLHPGEVAYLRSKGYSVPDGVSERGSTRDVDGGAAVEFAVRYLGRRAGGRSTFALASRGVAFVERLEGGDRGDRVVTLATRYGLEIPFSRRGADWFRPLVAPDGIRFLDEDAFARACAGAEPWADSPFVVPPVLGGYRGSPVAVLETAVPEGSDASRNAPRREAESRASLARAGRLVSIDGVVNVRSTAPVLVPVVTHADDVSKRNGLYVCPLHVSVGWASGHVDSETDFGPMPNNMATSPMWSVSRTERWPCLPLDQFAMARDVAHGYAKGLGTQGTRYRDVAYDTGVVEGDAKSVLEGILEAMPTSVAEGMRRRRNVVLQGLRSRDVGRLVEESKLCRVGDGDMVATMADVAVLALGGKYDASPSHDDEAELAAMVP